MSARSMPSFPARRLGGTVLAIAVLFTVSVPTGPLATRAEDARPFLTSRRLPPAPRLEPLAVGAAIRTTASQRRRVVLPEGTVVYVNEITTAKLIAAQPTV